MITAALLNQVRAFVQQNINMLLGRTLIMAGGATLFKTFIVIVVNILGFTVGGVLPGKYLLPIYTSSSWLYFSWYFLGSIAALIQSAIYGGQTAGLFSVFQWFGATAAISSPAVIGAGGTMAVVGVGLQFMKKTVKLSI